MDVELTTGTVKGQDKLKEEPLEVTDSLVPPPVVLVMADKRWRTDGTGTKTTERRGEV